MKRDETAIIVYFVEVGDGSGGGGGGSYQLLDYDIIYTAAVECQ